MIEIIKQFYEDNNVPKPLLEQKMKMFSAHPDIASEFESWIVRGEYASTGAVTVEGYTAEKLAGLSDYLLGEGSFILLVELREHPEKAHRKIAGGFKRK